MPKVRMKAHSQSRSSPLANVITKLYATLDPRFWTGFKSEHQCRRGLWLSSDRYPILSTPAFLFNLSGKASCALLGRCDSLGGRRCVCGRVRISLHTHRGPFFKLAGKLDTTAESRHVAYTAGAYMTDISLYEWDAEKPSESTICRILWDCVALASDDF